MKVRLKDNINNTVVERELKIASKDHLQAQIKYPSTTIKPKKGKGSFTRKKKYKDYKDKY